MLLLHDNNTIMYKEVPMKIKTLVVAMIFFGALCASALFVSDAEACTSCKPQTVCIYCKQANYGGCGAAPSSADNPKRNHRHNSNGQDCVWCGTHNPATSSCSLSPTGSHQK